MTDRPSKERRKALKRQYKDGIRKDVRDVAVLSLVSDAVININAVILLTAVLAFCYYFFGTTALGVLAGLSLCWTALVFVVNEIRISDWCPRFVEALFPEHAYMKPAGVLLLIPIVNLLLIVLLRRAIETRVNRACADGSANGGVRMARVLPVIVLILLLGGLGPAYFIIQKEWRESPEIQSEGAPVVVEEKYGFEIPNAP